MREELRVVVRGRVQGVGFRQWIYDRATALGLGGWVCNHPDGSVEACFQGAKESLSQMLSASNDGPAFAKVELIEHTFSECGEVHESFSIHD